MKWKHYYLVVGVVALALASLLPQRSVPATEAGPQVSSYGHMQATGPGGKAVVLPLRATSVKAEVVGVMSSVAVTQHFHNPYKKPIEAIYVFPLPQHAAVHAMTMHVGQRVITAVIHKRGEARAIYERAKQQGKTASLLEQERPNIFTQSVANIMPGDQIRVELRYVEELAPREGEYEFVFPMVVGPRYMGEGRSGKDGTGWAEDTDRVPDASRISPPVLAPGTRPGNDISVSLRVNAGVAIRDLRAITHKVSLQRPASDLAVVDLDRGDRIPNRDFVVRYRLTGATPKVTFLTNREPGRGGHLLLMVQPQRQVNGAAVAPREYVFVVDTSGSMDGVPIAQVKKAMQRCLASLGAGDTFQIIRFANSAERLAAAPLTPTADNIRKALGFVDTLAGGGGTEFLPALELALKAPSDPKRSRIIAFMTDGYIGYESQVMKYLRDNLGAANLFSFGVGTSVNRYLIDGMARIGQGEPFVLLGHENEEAVIKRFFEMVSRPALTGISVDWGSLQVSDVTPRRPPDLFADRPVVLAGRFSAGGSGTVTVRGFLAGAPFEQKIDVTLPGGGAASSAPALSYLWARRTIGELMDRYDTDAEARRPVRRRVTELALQYSLMSKWTSFVAVDRVVRNAGGEQETAAVPVPLPEGVSEKAAPPAAYTASLSQDQFVPGDPEVIISAPEATAVTLIFPSGEVKACTRHPLTGKWIASFLIPEETPDGIYTVRVLITQRSGEQLTRTVRYQVDGSAPRVRLELTPHTVEPGQRVQLTLWPEALGSSPPLPSMATERRRPLWNGGGAAATNETDTDIGDPSFAVRVMQDIQRTQALLPSGETVELRPQPDGSYQASFAAPITEGRYPVRVVVRDQARNTSRRTLWLTVAQ